MSAPERLATERLSLRRPRPADADSIFARFASDSDVTRFLGWPRHQSIAATHAFLEFSDSEWTSWPAGPYLIESRNDGRLLGSTGLSFETPFRAATGYVLARDSWGLGYATEALRAIVALAENLGVRRLYALCHPDHPVSQRVLEKCGFEREGMLRKYSIFPNLHPDEPWDTVCYARVF